MSNYHYVSSPDLDNYVNRLSMFYPTLNDFLDDIQESINSLMDSEDNYQDELKFYERVKKNLLTKISKIKVVKSKKH